MRAKIDEAQRDSGWVTHTSAKRLRDARRAAAGGGTGGGTGGGGGTGVGRGGDGGGDGAKMAKYGDAAEYEAMYGLR